MERDIYPVAIVKSRYGGVYEGGKWFAINEELDRILDSTGSDCPCSDFFSMIEERDVRNFFGDRIFIGTGETPQEAYDNLISKIK